MARGPNEKAKEAQALYNSGMKLVDIANKLEVPSGTVRRWKSTYKWDGESESERSDKNNERSEREISWIDIEHEYVTDIRKKPCALEELAKKYKVSLQAIKNQSAKGCWSEKRTEYKQKINQKAIEKSIEEDSDRIARLLRITDRASQKAEQALDEIENYTVKNKKKTKTVEYKDEKAIGKPTKEIVEEIEDIKTVNGPVDRQGLLFVTNALKNIKDIYGIELDNEKLQAQISKIKQDSGQENDDGVVIINDAPSEE